MDYADILDLLEQETQTVSWITTDHPTAPGKGRDAAFDRWHQRTRNAKYSYRSIFHIETVADIGDDGDWFKCRENTIRLWSRLERWSIPHWRALSGGKGTHTHIFVARPDYRGPFMRWATTPRFLRDKRIEVDGLLIDPAPGNRMVREFGAYHPKTGWRKTLWTKKPEDLPLKREDAYRIQALTLPTSYVNAGQPPGANFWEIKQAFGGLPCPRSFKCLDGRDFCDECPVNR